MGTIKKINVPNTINLPTNAINDKSNAFHNMIKSSGIPTTRFDHANRGLELFFEIEIKLNQNN
jgi:hypothetical protein